jgi:WD40 repeat protein
MAIAIFGASENVFRFFRTILDLLGHTSAVLSISIQDNKIFSGSYDGSAKMWVIERGVELQSFKLFDDGVSLTQPATTGIFVALAGKLIHYIPQTFFMLQIYDMEGSVLGASVNSSSAVVASKTTRSILIHQIDGALNVRQSFDINASCSAFYSFESDDIFWLGLRDGSVLKYEISERRFSIMVFFFYLISFL